MGACWSMHQSVLLEHAPNLYCCFIVGAAISVKAEIHLHALRQHKQVVAVVSPHFHMHMHIHMCAVQQDTQVSFEHTAYMQASISTCALHYVEFQLPFAAGGQPISLLKTSYTRFGALPK